MDFRESDEDQAFRLIERTNLPRTLLGRSERRPFRSHKRISGHALHTQSVLFCREERSPGSHTRAAWTVSW